MRALRSIHAVAWADFAERTRSYAFLLMLGSAVWVAYESAVGHIVVRVDNYRGVFNSAWVGGAFSLVASTLLSLVGFYFIKGSVERDRRTRVGEILGATRMSSLEYACGKALSHVGVLLSVTAVLAGCAVLVQVFKGEVHTLDLGALLTPFLVAVVPGLFVSAALAVLFECTPLLSGTIGNVAFFVLWTTALAATIGKGVQDPFGIAPVFKSMSRACQLQHPGAGEGFSLTIAGESSVQGTFLWTGLEWSWATVSGRLAWMGIALVLVGVASLVFDRFNASPDPRMLAPRIRKQARPGARRLDARVFSGILGLFGGGGFLGLAGSELRLALQGLPWIWWLVLAGVLLAQSLAPLDVSRTILLPLGWLWPIGVWSSMGTRERQHYTGPLVFSSAGALSRQFPAMWLAGVVVALLASAGTGIRLALAGHGPALLGWGTGLVFIPTLALASGVLSGNRKFFEITYLVLWYMGLLQGAPGLDFAACSPETSPAMPLYYLAITAGLLPLAWLGRQRQALAG